MNDSWGLLGRDLKEAFGDIWSFSRRHWLIYSLVVVATLTIAFVWMFPRDLNWVLAAAPRGDSFWKRFAYQASDIGDGTLFLIVVIALRIFAGFRKNRYLQKLVVMYFAVALTTSLVARVGKNMTSRPRPKAAIKEGISHTQFMGPSLSPSKYHSFPSGHTATSLSSAMPVVATAHPAIGIPVMVMGGACAWSRFYTRNHYISDIFVSSVLSLLVSVAGVSSFNRRRREGDF